MHGAQLSFVYMLCPQRFVFRAGFDVRHLGLPDKRNEVIERKRQTLRDTLPRLSDERESPIDLLFAMQQLLFLQRDQSRESDGAASNQLRDLSKLQAHALQRNHLMQLRKLFGAKEPPPCCGSFRAHETMTLIQPKRAYG